MPLPAVPAGIAGAKMLGGAVVRALARRGVSKAVQKLGPKVPGRRNASMFKSTKLRRAGKTVLKRGARALGTAFLGEEIADKVFGVDVKGAVGEKVQKFMGRGEGGATREHVQTHEHPTVQQSSSSSHKNALVANSMHTYHAPALKSQQRAVRPQRFGN